MCDLNCVNLIDLSLEDKSPCSKTQKNVEYDAQTEVESLHFIPPNFHKRESLENNPFDRAQKLVDYLNDPFDIVEKEACLRAYQAIKPAAEVKLGNLLSLSNENLLDEVKMSQNPTMVTKLSKVNVEELDLESPTVPLHENQSPNSVSGPETDSNPNSSTEISASAKLKKKMEYRKRLLKLSISNASLSSPITGKQNFEFEDITGTPVSSMLNRAEIFGEHLLASESPLKLVEDEDLIYEETLNFLDSEKKFEADLAMLQIPILSEITSPAEQTSKQRSTETTMQVENGTSATVENIFPNIEAIKAKINAKKEAVNNIQQQDISSLIQNLKTLISSEEIVDKSKKQKASDLLESLSSALKPFNKEPVKALDMLIGEPEPIKRQGTFDVELQRKRETNLDKQPLVQEMPNCMVSSSATYDGETADEKQRLNLPDIDPLSPQTSPHPSNYQHNTTEKSDSEINLHADVNDIMEQLSKLLINNSADNPTNTNNPTFIVVMNANQFNHSNLNICNKSAVDAKLKSSVVANYLENYINDGSPDLSEVHPMPRRRTQSLSSHDKVKIVQLPLQQLTPRSKKNQHSAKLDEPPLTPTTTPSGRKEVLECKTPKMVRRNSYSSGTPCTSQVGVRHTGFGYRSESNSTQIRKNQTLDTHHEGQHQAIVRPMSMPSNNLLTFKPDLKKKQKHNTESIIKSSAPLKATIPMKKVSPMLKTSPPTPETTLQTTSLQSQSKKSRTPTTPLRAKGSSTLGVGFGYPNAFSTPSPLTSPLKRSSGPVNKPRYSYMSATPNSKTSAIYSSPSASLKRRTVSEFKAKSPLKRVGSAGLAASASATSSPRASIGSSRLSTSTGDKISKTPVKEAATNRAAGKLTSRLSSRISVGASVLSTRNKENKRP